MQLFEDRARECSKPEARSNEWWSVKMTFTKEITRSCRDDYRDYILGLIDQTAVAAEKGNAKLVSELVSRIKGTNSYNTTQPTLNKKGGVFGSMDELLAEWKEFAEQKFEATTA